VTSLEDIWDDNHLPPFFGNLKQLRELGEVFGKCIDNCNASSSIREIVLETWITVDFAIRQLLLSGFDLTRFSDQKLDIGYLILPNSFKELVGILKKTGKYCCKEHKSESTKEKIDKSSGLRASYGFWKFIKENDRELFQRIWEVSDEYNWKMHPELSENESVYHTQGPQSVFNGKNQAFEEFNDQWKEVICKFDDNWFKMVDRLNAARNAAAHNYDASQIGERLGKKAPNLVNKVRLECFSLLESLFNVRLRG